MNVESIATIIENITGADPLRAGRARPVVESRALLANVLLAQGWTEEQTAAAIGFDRCTVHHYKEMLNDAIRYNCNPQMLGSWNRLKNIYDL